MAEKKLTTADLVAGLSDIRLPSEAPGGLFAEVMAIIGIGLLLAVFVSFLLPLVTRQGRETRPASLTDEIDQARKLSADNRTTTLLNLLKTHDPRAAKQLSKNIYSVGGLPDPNDLEAILLRDKP